MNGHAMTRTLQRLDQYAIWIAVAAVVSIMAITCISVASRYFLGRPVPDDLTISENLMILLVFLPLAAVQGSREHVFVTIFTDWMPNRVRVAMEIFGILVGIVFFGILTWASWVDFAHAYRVGEYTQGPLNIPHAPFKFVLFAGLFLFLVRLVVDFVLDLAGFISGKAQAHKSEEDRVLEKDQD